MILYSQLHSQDSFEQTLSGREPASEVPIDSVPNGTTIPVASLTHHGKVSLRLPVTTGSASNQSVTSPALSLDCQTGQYCPGVYPLQLVLFDTGRGTQLSSLTTYVVYAPPQTGALKLRVGLVLPLGDAASLTPSGEAALGPDELRKVATIATHLAALPGGTVSVALHPQLLAGLARTPHGAAHGIADHLAAALGGGTRCRQELLGAPFADVDPSALAAAGLGDELQTQLGVARRTEAGVLGEHQSKNPWVTGQPLDPAGLRLLEANGIEDLVLAPGSLASPPTSTPVAPFRVVPAGSTSGAKPALAFASDHASRGPSTGPPGTRCSRPSSSWPSSPSSTSTPPSPPRTGRSSWRPPPTARASPS